MICDGAVTMRGAVHRLTARRPARRRTWERVSVAAVATVDRCDCASVSTDDGRTRWCQLRRSGQRAEPVAERSARRVRKHPHLRLARGQPTFSVLDPSSCCSPPAPGHVEVGVEVQDWPAGRRCSGPAEHRFPCGPFELVVPVPGRQLGGVSRWGWCRSRRGCRGCGPSSSGR
jgi:hypothetical protein